MTKKENNKSYKDGYNLGVEHTKNKLQNDKLTAAEDQYQRGYDSAKAIYLNELDTIKIENNKLKGRNQQIEIAKSAISALGQINNGIAKLIVVVQHALTK